MKLGVPEEKQQHLLSYLAKAEFHELEAAVKRSLPVFRRDTEEICEAKGITYPERTVQQIISYFHWRMDSDTWE